MTIIRGANLNVCALPRWAQSSGLNPSFKVRGPKIANRLKDFDVDFLAVEELVTYENAQILSRAMGWGGHIVGENDQGKGTGRDTPKAGDSCVLHGDGGVATGLIWDPKKIRCISCGQSKTYVGRYRRNFKETHGRFEIIGAEKYTLTVGHFEFEPKGPNYKSHWGNRERYLQADAQIDNNWSPPKTLIIMVDANGDLNDEFDGFGRALHAHDMRDTDETAKVNQNGHIGTAKTTWKRGGRIIRNGHTRDVRIPFQTTVGMAPLLDHNMLVTDFDIPN